MADSSRQQKLAAARRKLKQFQQKKTPSNSPAQKVKKSDKSVNNRSLANDVSSTSSIDGYESFATAPRTPATHAGDQRVEKMSPPTSNRTISSSESLRQMKHQLNGLVSEASLLNGGGKNDLDTSIHDLELRNQELAASLKEKSQDNLQLSFQYEEIKSQCNKLQEQIHKEKEDIHNLSQREQGALKEQLQVHIQTIGILVSEKSDLQSNLNQSNMSIHQRNEEINNLSSRLEASRQRVADLERDFANAHNSSQQLQRTSSDLDRERDQLLAELNHLRNSNEELSQQNSELVSELRAKISENQHLETSLHNSKSSLNMAELRVQQLTKQSEPVDYQQDLQRLQEENMALQQTVAQYQQSLQQLTMEREHLNQQSQQQNNHLMQQIQNLASQTNTLLGERQQLVSNIQSYQQQINNLQDELENQKVQQNDVTSSSISEDELKGHTDTIQRLQEEKLSLEHQYKAQVNDNAQLSNMYREAEEQRERLDNEVMMLREEASDRSSLLENVQSDKATISRALSQNKELKTQLQELQNAFVKMSNDNMELTTKVQTEEHVNNELSNKIADYEDDISSIKNQLRIKESETDRLKTQTFELNKQLMHQSQIQDRIHHYEAHGPMKDKLETELADTQEKLSKLLVENDNLIAQLAAVSSSSVGNQSHDHDHDHPDSTCNDSFSRDEMVNTLSTALRQLEMERDQLSKSFNDQREQHHILLQQMEDIQSQHSQAPAMTPEGTFVTNEDFETMSHAMDLLQKKFLQVMAQKADMDDLCQELEHKNMQLQSETETIGEYISLYHSQRQVMKKRQDDRERYVISLAKEKEVMQMKLAQLQNLVMQLLGEKSELPAHLHHSADLITEDMVTSVLPNAATTSMNGPTHKVKKNKSLGGSLDSTTLDDYSDDWSSSDTESVEEAMEDRLPEISPIHMPEAPHQNHIPQREKTAQQIMNLLEEISGPNIIDRGTILDHSFLPCKCCEGRIIDV
ncbi:golgin subfamily A member 2-like [Antedon mediterranea]|uniref:golgin subfamily A member 2-like n=1 Tax=Antedon mediterranea TaxID=105859 RepID=UPI003AF9EBF8